MLRVEELVVRRCSVIVGIWEYKMLRIERVSVEKILCDCRNIGVVFAKSRGS